MIADCQNIDIGAARLNLTVDWHKLAKTLRNSSRTLHCHAILDEDAGSDVRSSRFAKMGWNPHVKTTRTIRTRNGWERKSNIDHLLAFYAGLLASRSAASLILICSGDGDLVEDVAEALRQLPTPRPVATLSLAYSTAWRLKAQSSALIEFNVELGMDCLHRRSNVPA